MFDKLSGFFKRFSRRQKKQSGETTIMDAKEPGLDDFAMDESFGDMSEIEQSIDKIGTAPVGADEGQPGADVSFPDAEFDTGEMDFTTGASDFDEQTISDEISGASEKYADSIPEAQAPGAFDEQAGESPFDMPAGEPEPKSKVKGVLITGGVLVLCLVIGGLLQVFGLQYAPKLPVVGNLVAGKEAAKVNIADQLDVATQKNRKLKSEVGQFKGIGSPAEVKGLEQQIAQARDSQGPVDELETKLNAAREKEAAYDELVKNIDSIESEIAKTRSDINGVRSRIEEAKLKVVALRTQTEQEYARFQNELARAEISQRTVIELEKEDNQRFQMQLKDLQEYLSRLDSQPVPVSSSEAEPAGSDAVGS